VTAGAAAGEEVAVDVESAARTIPPIIRTDRREKIVRIQPPFMNMDDIAVSMEFS
jgi:hypothetical protein